MDASLYAHSNASMSFHLLRLNTDVEPVAFPYPWNKVKRGPSASPRSRARAPSIWSTSSICSEDSLAESDTDDDDNETEPESLFSTPSPTSTTSSSLWSARASSCADPYNMYNDGASLLSLPPSPQDARFPRAGDKPRGPRNRPLPTLPTHRPSSSSGSPTSPLASNSPITASHIPSPLSQSIQLQQEQPVVVVSAPREDEPKPSSKRSRPRVQTNSEQMSFERSLRIASQEDFIDWDRIEEIMCYSDG